MSFAEEDFPETYVPENPEQGAIRNVFVPKNGFQKYIFPSGDEYEGDWLNDKMHGQGRLLLNIDKSLNGTKVLCAFTGTFVDGLPTVGRTEWADNSMFEGPLVNGVPHGQGVYMKGGLSISGEFVNGEASGHCEVSFRDHTGTSTYTGEMVGESFHGKGTIFFDDDSPLVSLSGTFSQGVRHGEATILFRDPRPCPHPRAGAEAYIPNSPIVRTPPLSEFSSVRVISVTAIFTNGLPTSGTIKYIDGSVYIGDIVGHTTPVDSTNLYGKGNSPHIENPKVISGTGVSAQFEMNTVWVSRHGKGTLTLLDGTVIDGNWENNNLHGLGVTTFPNGDVYKGFFLNNTRHGQGLYLFGCVGNMHTLTPEDADCVIERSTPTSHSRARNGSVVRVTMDTRTRSPSIYSPSHERGEDNDIPYICTVCGTCGMGVVRGAWQNDVPHGKVDIVYAGMDWPLDTPVPFSSSLSAPSFSTTEPHNSNDNASNSGDDNSNSSSPSTSSSRGASQRAAWLASFSVAETNDSENTHNSSHSAHTMYKNTQNGGNYYSNSSVFHSPTLSTSFNIASCTLTPLVEPRISSVFPHPLCFSGIYQYGVPRWGRTWYRNGTITTGFHHCPSEDDIKEVLSRKLASDALSATYMLVKHSKYTSADDKVCGLVGLFKYGMVVYDSITLPIPLQVEEGASHNEGGVAPIIPSIYVGHVDMFLRRQGQGTVAMLVPSQLLSEPVVLTIPSLPSPSLCYTFEGVFRDDVCVHGTLTYPGEVPDYDIDNNTHNNTTTNTNASVHTHTSPTKSASSLASATSNMVASSPSKVSNIAAIWSGSVVCVGIRPPMPIPTPFIALTQEEEERGGLNFGYGFDSSPNYPGGKNNSMKNGNSGSMSISRTLSSPSSSSPFAIYATENGPAAVGANVSVENNYKKTIVNLGVSELTILTQSTPTSPSSKYHNTHFGSSCLILRQGLGEMKWKNGEKFLGMSSLTHLFPGAHIPSSSMDHYIGELNDTTPLDPVPLITALYPSIICRADGITNGGSPGSGGVFIYDTDPTMAAHIKTHITTTATSTLATTTYAEEEAKDTSIGMRVDVQSPQNSLSGYNSALPSYLRFADISVCIEAAEAFLRQATMMVPPLRDGLGILSFGNLSRKSFRGFFRNGCRIRGVNMEENGDLYIGEWNDNGKKHGKFLICLFLMKWLCQCTYIDGEITHSKIVYNVSEEHLTQIQDWDWETATNSQLEAFFPNIIFSQSAYIPNTDSEDALALPIYEEEIVSILHNAVVYNAGSDAHADASAGGSGLDGSSDGSVSNALITSSGLVKIYTNATNSSTSTNANANITTTTAPSSHPFLCPPPPTPMHTPRGWRYRAAPPDCLGQLSRAMYEGDVDEQFLPHGKGVWVFRGGQCCVAKKYEGEFCHGVCHGDGAVEYCDPLTEEEGTDGGKSGSTNDVINETTLISCVKSFAGKFEYGYPVYGTILFTESSMARGQPYREYTGELQQGIPNGNGILLYSAGHSFKGVIVKGVPKYGTFTHANGCVYHGNMNTTPYSTRLLQLFLQGKAIQERVDAEVSAPVSPTSTSPSPFSSTSTKSASSSNIFTNTSNIAKNTLSVPLFFGMGSVNTVSLPLLLCTLVREWAVNHNRAAGTNSDGALPCMSLARLHALFAGAGADVMALLHQMQDIAEKGSATNDGGDEFTTTTTSATAIGTASAMDSLPSLESSLLTALSHSDIAPTSHTSPSALTSVRFALNNQLLVYTPARTVSLFGDGVLTMNDADLSTHMLTLVPSVSPVLLALAPPSIQGSHDGADKVPSCMSASLSTSTASVAEPDKNVYSKIFTIIEDAQDTSLAVSSRIITLLTQKKSWPTLPPVSTSPRLPIPISQKLTEIRKKGGTAALRTSMDSLKVESTALYDLLVLLRTRLEAEEEEDRQCRARFETSWTLPEASTVTSSYWPTVNTIEEERALLKQEMNEIDVCITQMGEGQTSVDASIDEIERVLQLVEAKHPTRALAIAATVNIRLSVAKIRKMIGKLVYNLSHYDILPNLVNLSETDAKVYMRSVLQHVKQDYTDITNAINDCKNRCRDAVVNIDEYNTTLPSIQSDALKKIVPILENSIEKFTITSTRLDNCVKKITNTQQTLRKSLLSLESVLESRKKSRQERSQNLLTERLHSAVMDNDLQQVYDLLHTSSLHTNPVFHVNVLEYTPSGYSALHLAIQRGLTGMIRLLHCFSASLLQKDARGRTAFTIAMEERHPAMVEVLVELGYPINRPDGEEKVETELHKAAYDADPLLVKYLISLKADVNARNKKKQTPLMLVCKRIGEMEKVDDNAMDVVKILLANGAKPNVVDEQRNAAMHFLHPGASKLRTMMIGMGCRALQLRNNANKPVIPSSERNSGKELWNSFLTINPKCNAIMSNSDPRWVPDTASEFCQECEIPFGMFTRRHHCRVTGALLCSSCSEPCVLSPNGLVRACSSAVNTYRTDLDPSLTQDMKAILTAKHRISPIGQGASVSPRPNFQLNPEFNWELVHQYQEQLKNSNSTSRSPPSSPASSTSTSTRVPSQYSPARTSTRYMPANTHTNNNTDEEEETSNNSYSGVSTGKGMDTRADNVPHARVFEEDHGSDADDDNDDLFDDLV